MFGETDTFSTKWKQIWSSNNFLWICKGQDAYSKFKFYSPTLNLGIYN